MGIGDLFLRVASSAFGTWIAGLFKRWGWKRQGAQEASTASLESAIKDAEDAQRIVDVVAGMSHSELIDFLRSKYPGRYNE